MEHRLAAILSADAAGYTHPSVFGAPMNLAAIYSELGELNQGRAALADMLRLRPDFSIAKMPRLATGRQWLIANLRKLGLPE